MSESSFATLLTATAGLSSAFQSTLVASASPVRRAVCAHLVSGVGAGEGSALARLLSTASWAVGASRAAGAALFRFSPASACAQQPSKLEICGCGKVLCSGHDHPAFSRSSSGPAMAPQVLERPEQDASKRVLSVDEFLLRVEESVASHGFREDNCIAMSNSSHSCSTLLEDRIEELFGSCFSTSSLRSSSQQSCRFSGIQACLSHAPVVAGKERYVFFSFPQVTLDCNGRLLTPLGDTHATVRASDASPPLSSGGSSGNSTSSRSSSGGSGSDNSLGSSDFTFSSTSSNSTSRSTSTGWQHAHPHTHAHSACVNGDAYVGSHCEHHHQSLHGYGQHQQHHHGMQRHGMQRHGMQHRSMADDILKACRMAHEKADPSRASLVDAAKVAERARKDLEYLIEKAVDPKKADYAVFTGMQIHNWASDLSSDTPSIEFVSLGKSYVVVDGKRVDLDLKKVPTLSPRQLQVSLSRSFSADLRLPPSPTTTSVLAGTPSRALSLRAAAASVGHKQQQLMQQQSTRQQVQLAQQMQQQQRQRQARAQAQLSRTDSVGGGGDGCRSSSTSSGNGSESAWLLNQQQMPSVPVSPAGSHSPPQQRHEYGLLGRLGAAAGCTGLMDTSRASPASSASMGLNRTSSASSSMELALAGPAAAVVANPALWAT